MGDFDKWHKEISYTDYKGDLKRAWQESAKIHTERERARIVGRADDFVSIGYDLYIYDKSGEYPGGLEREDWVKKEITGIIGQQGD